MKTEAPQETLLSEGQVAKWLGYSTRTLQKWRWLGAGPPFVRISPRSVRYRRRDVADWIEGNLRISTADTGEGYLSRKEEV